MRNLSPNVTEWGKHCSTHPAPLSVLLYTKRIETKNITQKHYGILGLNNNKKYPYFFTRVGDP